MGFGLTSEFGKLSTVLRKLPSKITRRYNCFGDKLEKFGYPKHFCTIGNISYTNSEGDSGGPVITRVRKLYPFHTDVQN